MDPSCYDPILSYNDSKLLGVMFSIEAAERWRNKGIRTYAVHPGIMVSTNLARHSWCYRYAWKDLLKSFWSSFFCDAYIYNNH